MLREVVPTRAPQRGISSHASTFLALAMRFAAIRALLTLYGVGLWHVRTALGAGDHHLGAPVRMPWLGARFFACVIG